MAEDGVQPSSPEPDDAEVFKYDDLPIMKRLHAKDDNPSGNVIGEQPYRPMSPHLPVLNYPRNCESDR